MARLPQIGSDDGIWGTLLNQFLLMAHTSDGTLKDGIIVENNLSADVQTKLNATATGGVSTVNNRSGAVTLLKTDVGLPDVDNTSDASKPVSAATQSALNAKAAISHTHTATQISNATTVGLGIITAVDAAAARSTIGAGISNLTLGSTAGTAKAGDYVPTKTDVGLSNVDNTADANKPVSSAQQTALNAKAALSHTHTASQINDATNTGRNLLTAVDTAAARTAIGAGTSNLTLGTTSSTAKAGDYLPTKSDIGLDNVDNTADANKPVSTATQTALAAKADVSALSAHTANVSNPHATTKSQIGLGNVQNQSILVLGPSDPVPAGTPAGTVIIRTS